MKEKTTQDRIEAAIDAFGSERLRWLIGKGDVLTQRNELTKEKLQELVDKTVREEIDRSTIARRLNESPSTISEISKTTKLETHYILENLLAMMKWNRVEIVDEKNREYVYALKEV